MSRTDNLVSFVASLQDPTIQTLLSTFFLTMGRIVPLVVIIPFFGAKNLPATVRMMFSMAITLIFWPHNLLAIRTVIPFDMVYVGYFCKELLIGSCLAFLATVPFWVIQSAGTLIDHSRGSSALQVTDPSTQVQTSPIGILFNYVLLVVFFALNGPFLFFDGIARSYELMPVDALVDASFFNLQMPFWKTVVGLLQKMMDLTIQFAGPTLLAILFTDLFLGIANRLAPQVQIVFLGIGLKSWVALAILAVSWPLVIQTSGKEAILWMKSIWMQISQAAHFVRH